MPAGLGTLAPVLVSKESPYSYPNPERIRKVWSLIVRSLRLNKVNHPAIRQKDHVLYGTLT